MKYIIAIIAGLTLAISGVEAQQYNTGSISFVVAASTTTNTAAGTGVFGVTKYEDVCIWVNSKIADSGTDNTVVNFSKSADGTTYETTPSVVITVANTGTVNVNTITNINVGAAGYLKLVSVVNGDGSGNLTNIVTVAKKPQRFGK
jgi:hypothetical protein